MSVPPSFILVCNNTATSTLLYDYYISSFYREQAEAPNNLKTDGLRSSGTSVMMAPLSPSREHC